MTQINVRKRLMTGAALFTIHCSLFTGSAAAQIQTNAGVQYLQCMQKDMSTDFYDLSNTYFFADSLVSFDAQKGGGLVQWKRYRMSPRQAFNLNGYWPVRMQMLDFPDAAYENDPALKIKIEWVSPRTARIRMLTTPVEPKNTDQEDVMFCEGYKKKAEVQTTPAPPNLGGERAVNKHPEYGKLRKLRYKEDFLYSYDEIDKMFGLLFMNNKDNKMALDYFLAQMLLKGNMQGFQQYLGLAQQYGGYRQMPLGYQDAMRCIQMQGNVQGSPYANYVKRIMAERRGK